MTITDDTPPRWAAHVLMTITPPTPHTTFFGMHTDNKYVQPRHVLGPNSVDLASPRGQATCKPSPGRRSVNGNSVNGNGHVPTLVPNRRIHIHDRHSDCLSFCAYPEYMEMQYPDRVSRRRQAHGLTFWRRQVNEIWVI